jgi:hypothetical protein
MRFGVMDAAMVQMNFADYPAASARVIYRVLEGRETDLDVLGPVGDQAPLGALLLAYYDPDGRRRAM